MRPSSKVTKIGHEYVQNSYSQQFWWPNWQRVTYCWQLKDGYCPKDDTRVETHTQIAMSASGQEAAVGMVKTPLRPDGLQHPRKLFANVPIQRHQPSVYQHVEPGGTFPWAK